MTMISSRLIIAGGVSIAAACGAPSFAQDEEAPASPVVAALSDLSASVAARVRYEFVDQDGFDDSANALTYRIRAGIETGEAYDTKALVEFDWVEDLAGDFNSTTNGVTDHPVVADPDVVELNRFQLTNTSLPDTTVTLGRQRINLDDQRFVGAVGWRQNEQTFDAVRAVNTSLPGVTVDVSYINQVNRIFGDESAVGRFDGDVVLANASGSTPLGKLTGFAYLLDFDDAAALSSNTYGVRLAGSQPVGDVTVTYAGSYATQSDTGDNPFDYDADYYSIDAGAKFDAFAVGAGYEVLEGDGTRAFTTPLATLHKFQGFSDKFLVTPADGVEDLYASVGYGFTPGGLIKKVNLKAVYHDFDSNNTDADLGSEINLVAAAKFERFGLLLKYADYEADSFATDTQKLWLQFDIAF